MISEGVQGVQSTIGVLAKLKEAFQNITSFVEINGKAITFFNGAITLNQVILIAIAIILVVIILKFLEGTAKAVLCTIICAMALLNFNLASPTKLDDVNSKIAEQGIEAFQQYANLSESIKVEGETIKINIGGTWVDINEIQSFVSTGEETLSVIVNGDTFNIEDENVKILLQQLSNI